MSLWHRFARITLSISLPFAVGCPDRPLARVPIDADVVDRTNIPLNDNRDMDILFVIDNSRSMDGEQSSLAAEFPLIIDAIYGAASQPSIHLGVISSDVGGGQLCPGVGDDGALLTGETACNAINDGANFIRDIANLDGTRNTNFDGELRDAFACMAVQGTLGCGFEQPLESLRRALDNPANAGFFRDDAYLAVIFVTDEDDCSLSGPTMLDDDGDRTTASLTTELGPADSFRCFEFGVKCEFPGGLREDGVRSNCIPREDSPFMSDVAGFVADLRAKKQFSSQVLVAAIAGDLEPVIVEHRTSSIYREVAIPQLVYSCDETGLGEAVPPVRLAAFLGAFESANQLVSICQDDLTGAVGEIADFLGGVFDPPCLAGNLADTSPEPGIQPQCSVVYVVAPGAQTETQTVVVACDEPANPAASSTLPCYQLRADPANCGDTPTQLTIDIFYPTGVSPPPFSQAEVNCVGVAPI